MSSPPVARFHQPKQSAPSRASPLLSSAKHTSAPPNAACPLLVLSRYSQDDRTARASHVLLSVEQYPETAEPNGLAMANALKAKIEGGEFTFEFVAEKFSACPSGDKGGDLGTFKRGDMVPEFDRAVFEVNEDEPIGTLLGPIKTVFGYHLIKVVERDASD